MEFTDNVFGTEDFSDNLLFGLGLTWMVVAEKMININKLLFKNCRFVMHFAIKLSSRELS